MTAPVFCAQNVALSRAKHGMYVIGNFDMLTRYEKLWRDIYETTDNRSKGTALPLVCQLHANACTVSTVDDFQNVPDGGCRKPCGFRNACGHTCPRLCHADDIEHKRSICNQPCSKAKPFANCNHKCPYKCSEECGDCPTPVIRLMPGCNHPQEMQCGVSIQEFLTENGGCPYAISGTYAACGHDDHHICLQRNEPRVCQTLVELVWPECKHTRTVKCGVPRLLACPEVCGAVLECGHACTGSCEGCHKANKHVPCVQKCTRTLLCGHKWYVVSVNPSQSRSL